MNVVLPFWSGDVEQAKALLLWAIELDGKVPNTGVLVFDDKTDGTEVAKLAVQYFKDVIQLRIDSPPDRTWPRPQNHYFQRTAFQYSLKSTLNQVEWLWWETDAWPLTKGWLATIEASYKAGKKPFMGPIVRPQGYTAGVSVYPGKVTEFFTDAMLIKNAPWDIVSQKDVRGKVHDSSSIMQHERDAGPFRCKSDLARIRPGVVLYHRCKDTSLVDIIRNGHSEPKPEAPSIISLPKTERIYHRVETQKRSVCVHRDSAIGDVIMASGIVRKLALEGRDASLWCRDVIAPLFDQDDCVLTVEAQQAGQELVDLNGVYEGHPDVKTVPKPVLMARKCLVEPFNITPVLRVKPAELPCSGPRIAISPRSNSWAVRSVPKLVWESTRGGTLVWVGTDEAPEHMIDAKCRTVRQLAETISACDGMVSVDTGPMHIAAALGKPVIAIAQACSPDLHLSDQRDFRAISTGLNCLNCHEPKCPISEISPPCGMIEPSLISSAINQMIETMNGHKVSAIIPVWKPNVGRLNQCLKAIISQVDEVVIGVDGDGIIPIGVMTDHRIKWVQNRSGQRRGFGKTCNHAARHSTGSFLLILNDDVFLDQNAVAAMRDVLIANARAAVVGAFLRHPDGTTQHGGTTRATRDVGWGHIDHGKNQKTVTALTEMENVTHACAMIRRKAFYEVLGYDEDFDCYWEDNAFNLAVRQAGWKVMYQPVAEGIHAESQTTSPLKQELAAKGQKVFERKWMWYFEKNQHNQMGTFK